VEDRVRQAVAITNTCSDSSKTSPSSNGNAWKTLNSGKTRTILKRLIGYSEKIFGLAENVLAKISDQRPQPHIPTRVCLKASLAMFWARWAV